MEIDKFYLFYSDLEIQLIESLNEHQVSSFDKMHTSEFLEQLNRIDKTSHLLLDVCTFININVTGIRKILKKMDKSLDSKKHSVSIEFIKEQLENEESNLLYILEFRKIDELAAILEDRQAKLANFYKANKQNLERTCDKNEPLLNNGFTYITYELDKEVSNLLDSTYSTLEKVDTANDLIRTGLSIWNLLVSSRFIGFDSKTKVYNNTFDLNADRRRNLIARMAPQSTRDVEVMTAQDYINVFLCLLHTFLYSLNTYIVQPTNASYLASMNASPFISGALLGLSPLAAIFSTLIFSWMTNYSYKIPLIISVMCFLAGNFFYSYADNLQSVVVMGLGRLLIGFAGGRVINRRYLIDHVPKSTVTFYSLVYVIATSVGMATGPLIGLALFYLDEVEEFGFRFNYMTNAGWICSVFWVFYFCLLIPLFRNKEKTEEKSDEEILLSNDELPEVKLSQRKLTINQKTSEHDEVLNEDVKQMKEENLKLTSSVSQSFLLLLAVLGLSKVTV